MSMNQDHHGRPLSERTEPTSESVAHSSFDSPARSVRDNRAPARSAVGSPSSVDLHIEELVLHGFEPAQRHAIGDALERELSRLLTEQGSAITITQDVEIALLNGGTLNLKPGANSEATGIELARTIYRGLAK